MKIAATTIISQQEDGTAVARRPTGRFESMIAVDRVSTFGVGSGGFNDELSHEQRSPAQFHLAIRARHELTDGSRKRRKGAK
jgi:hypothetical protein